MRINYDGRVFRSVSNTGGGDVDEETRFHYHQTRDTVWATYEGGAVRFGMLLATVDASGLLDARYQHITTGGLFRSGSCQSAPEVLSDGRLRLHEVWRWTDGSDGEGATIVEEVSE